MADSLVGPQRRAWAVTPAPEGRRHWCGRGRGLRLRFRPGECELGLLVPSSAQNEKRTLMTPREGEAGLHKGLGTCP